MDFAPTEEELKDIEERLDNIKNYNDLKDKNSRYREMIMLPFIIGIVLGGFDVWVIIKYLLAHTLILGLGIPIGLGAISIVLLGITGYEIKHIISNNKEIKELKQKGVKKDKSVLLEKKKDLENEKKLYQDRNR